MTSFIWDRQSGKQIAWIENDHDVYSVVTKRKFATVRDGKLYSLSGEFLNVHLDNLYSESADLVSSAKDTESTGRVQKAGKRKLIVGAHMRRLLSTMVL